MVYSNLKILFSVLIISVFLFYSFSLVLAQESTFDNLSRTFIQSLKESLRQAFEIWRSVHQKILNYWKGNLLPKIQNWIKTEISKREPIIRKQIQEEKSQVKEEIKELYTKTWQWLKNLIF
jgi:hypothetical protein